jgi:hypothetical protein
MEPFADASGLDLVRLFKYHLNISKSNPDKYTPLTKNRKLALIQNGIELLRKSFSLDDLLSDKKKKNLKHKSEDFSFDNFLKKTLFPPQNPPLLDVIFEIVEWNCLGPALWPPFKQIFDYLFPSKYIEYLQKQIIKNKNLPDEEIISVQNDSNILKDKDFPQKLYKKLCS